MRFIKEFDNSFCQTSIYSFNNKFIIKFEAGMLEQTIKISELDVSGLVDIEMALTESFYAGVLERFRQMEKAVDEAFFGF